MRVITCTAIGLVLIYAPVTRGQGTARTLVAVWAHADDEGPVGPILARYAREGAQVHMIIATDGTQGAANTSVPRGPEIAKLRVDEARCSAQALGIQPPILLGFPDGALGNYQADPSMLYRLTQRLQEELQRLQPHVLITWGPDGGYGHPDHRIINSIVSQLVRREARTKGTPQLGAGAIYQLPESELTISPFELPAHWPRCWGMDTDQGAGWTAAVWLALRSISTTATSGSTGSPRSMRGR